MHSYENAGQYIAIKRESFRFQKKYSLEKADAALEWFQKTYSPEVLHKVRKPDIYDTVFKLESQSMIFQMNREDDGTTLSSMGHIGRQWVNNFPFRENGNMILLGRGFPNANQRVTKQQACEIGFLLLHALLECTEYLSSHPMITLNDYLAFEDLARNKLRSHASHAWIHKYLHMIFPYFFTEFHTRDYRKKALVALGIQPIDSLFATDWQFIMIQKVAKVEHPYLFANILYSLKEVTDAVKGRNITSVLPSTPLVKGAYGNWEVKSDKQVLLMVDSEMLNDGSLEIPYAIEPYFEEKGLDRFRTVIFYIGNEKYPVELCSGENGMELNLGVDLSLNLRNRIKETDDDIVIAMVNERKNVYSCTIFEIPTPLPTIPAADEDKISQAESLTVRKLYRIAKQRESRDSDTRVVTSTTRVRDPYIAEYAKRRANGICQLCEEAAPFLDQKGKPYLESHHIVFLSEGGEDSLTNTVALCPNCHRRIHILQDAADTAKLKEKNSHFEKYDCQ